jgi:cyclohexanone monooxygenase
MASAAPEPDLGFDVEALREKYRIERDKRLRPDGADQYIELSGEWARFNESDPYAETILERDPITDEIEVAVIGGGFSGLLASARLIEAGIEDFHVIEAGSDFGGTWYWNRYPGAQCDIESYCYLPLLEELNYMPKEKYSYGDEIFEHSQRVGRHYGLYERTWFQTRVRSVDWDESIKRWRISTNRGDDIKARFVVLALGTASRGKLPGIPGIDEFEGHAFHTSRWDYAYTGGLHDGRMTELADKRVAIIGTGATAIQCVPRVARYAQHLYVFQRTPSSVDLRGNKPTDPEWWASLEPGWQRERRDNFGAILSGRPVEEDLVNDGWTSTFHDVMELAKGDRSLTGREFAKLMELADYKKMEEIRQRAEELVDDPDTAEALKPYYRRFCKRPTFNDEYLPCFNQDNVTLVDVSETKGVERITAHGVVANGVEHEVDCIIYASGFEITTEFRRRLGLEINGRDGVSLFDHWTPGRTKTLHGFSTRGFPNWFYIGISQNAFSANMTQMFDEQARHIAYIISETRARGGSTVEPTEAGQDEWAQVIASVQPEANRFFESCTPGYYNNEGQGGGGLGGGAYTPGINAFNALLEQWRDEGSMAGLELDRDAG